jgi:hypothetical protein
MQKLVPIVLSAACAAFAGGPGQGGEGPQDPAARTVLGIRGSRFTWNGEPTFLLGVSYYGALGATGERVGRDLGEMQRRGFRWIRVWATWGAFGNEVSAVEPASGRPREPFLSKLSKLVQECDDRGMVISLIFSRDVILRVPQRPPR